MRDTLKDIYYYLQENIEPDFLNDPEYKRGKEETERLWADLAAALGENGNSRLNALLDAEMAQEEFWQFALFRRTLAAGISLGRLEC